VWWVRRLFTNYQCRSRSILSVLFLISRNDLCCPCLYDFSIGFLNYSDSVVYLNYSDSVVFLNYSDSVVFLFYSDSVVFLFFIVLSINPEKSWNITWFDVLCWKVRPRESHSTNLQYSIIHHLSMSSTVSYMKRNTRGCNNQETTYIFHLC